MVMQDKYSDDTDDKIDAARDGMENQSLEQSIIIQFIKTSRLVWYWVTEPQHSYWVGFYLRYHFSGRSVLRIWILPGLQPWAISLTQNLNFAAFLHWHFCTIIFIAVIIVIIITHDIPLISTSRHKIPGMKFCPLNNYMKKFRIATLNTE